MLIYSCYPTGEIQGHVGPLQAESHVVAMSHRRHRDGKVFTRSAVLLGPTWRRQRPVRFPLDSLMGRIGFTKPKTAELPSTNLAGDVGWGMTDADWVTARWMRARPVSSKMSASRR